ncbi:MAG: NlpC/P60 family protein [Candidatus Angelobacter sp.]
MRSVLKFGLVVLSLLTAVGGPAARAETDDNSPATVLLSPEQGEAMAAFALQSERRIHTKPDCSHLVHLLYARAGLIYPYESSRVLYRGISDFKRVKAPQAGDLVVWLGHVGIVLSPEEKTFLSSVRSGILTESWTAPHWVHRGQPRFYRYRIGPETDINLLATIMGEDSRAQIESLSNARNGTKSELSSSATQAAADSDANGVQEEGGESPLQDAINTDESGHDSNPIALISQRQIPSRRQIAAAIIESSKARAHKLIGGEALDLAHPFSVFSRLEVEKIKVKNERGSITLKVIETMCQEDGRILPARIMERELTIVRRNDGAWAISDPQERTYLMEEQALEIFERQAELFLHRAPSSSNARIMVKALDRLYDQQTGTPQRAAIR